MKREIMDGILNKTGGKIEDTNHIKKADKSYACEYCGFKTCLGGCKSLNRPVGYIGKKKLDNVSLPQQRICNNNKCNHYFKDVINHCGLHKDYIKQCYKYIPVPREDSGVDNPSKSPIGLMKGKLGVSSGNQETDKVFIGSYEIKDEGLRELKMLSAKLEQTRKDIKQGQKKYYLIQLIAKWNAKRIDGHSKWVSEEFHDYIISNYRARSVAQNALIRQLELYLIAQNALIRQLELYLIDKNVQYCPKCKEIVKLEKKGGKKNVKKLKN